MQHVISLLILGALCLPACSAAPETPSPAAIQESFFSGRAVVDTNRDGQLDAGDAPLKDATFIVQLKGGAEFGGQTNEDGDAYVTIPGPIEYPVNLVMRPPKDSVYIPVGSTTITVDRPGGGNANFLFTTK